MLPLCVKCAYAYLTIIYIYKVRIVLLHMNIWLCVDVVLLCSTTVKDFCVSPLKAFRKAVNCSRPIDLHDIYHFSVSHSFVYGYGWWIPITIFSFVYFLFLFDHCQKIHRFLSKWDFYYIWWFFVDFFFGKWYLC